MRTLVVMEFLILLVFQLSQCQDECRGECGPDFVPPCGLNCERRPCNMGCTMYEDLVSQGEHESRYHCRLEHYIFNLLRDL